MAHPRDMEEPTANNRIVARETRGMYIAFIKEGFTPAEALTLIGQWLKAATTAAAGGESS